MDAEISEQIAKLASLSRSQLLDLWQEVYEKSAPAHLRRELLVPFLGYRMQEKFYGGLSRATRTELRRIARDLEKFRDAQVIQPKARPGTHLHREWRGQTHEVLITEAGFEYSGSSFASLSEVARKITGTRWSGPAFFGLTAAQKDTKL